MGLGFINPLRARFKLGTYTGDGAATQAITGVGFQPSVIVIMSGDSFRPTFVKTNTMAANAKNVETNGYLTDHIISFDADGFTIGDGTGDANRLNVAATVYHYIVMKEN